MTSLAGRTNSDNTANYAPMNICGSVWQLCIWLCGSWYCNASSLHSSWTL